MSNLTKQSIKIPHNINIKLKKNLLFIEGPLGNKTLKLLAKVVLNHKKKRNNYN
jgi:ribosomal protein L6P/L9E